MLMATLAPGAAFGVGNLRGNGSARHREPATVHLRSGPELEKARQEVAEYERFRDLAGQLAEVNEAICAGRRSVAGSRVMPVSPRVSRTAASRMLSPAWPANPVRPGPQAGCRGKVPLRCEQRGAP